MSALLFPAVLTALHSIVQWKVRLDPRVTSDTEATGICDAASAAAAVNDEFVLCSGL